MSLMIAKVFKFIAITAQLVVVSACSHQSKSTEPGEIPAEEDSLSDEDEYLLGRGVAARILEKFPPIKSPFNRYATAMARYLAGYSARPVTFKGYRAQLIDFSEVSSLSTPGGFIFISKPLVAATNSEDELAGVIAHEVAHVVLRHGEMAYRRKVAAEKNRKKNEKLVGSVANMAKSVAALSKSEKTKDLAREAQVGEKFYDNGIAPLQELLFVAGYNSDQEYAADQMAARLMLDAGYDPTKYAEFLGRNFSFAKRLKKNVGSPGSLFGTHPLDEKRVDRILNLVKGWKPGPRSAKREQRFKIIKEKTLGPQ